MTMTQDFTKAARTGQEATSTLLQTWGETVRSVLGMRTDPGEVPSPDHVIDAWFDVASEVLATQRQFAKAMLGMGNPVIDAMTRAAQQGTETIQQATNEATREDNGAQTREAGRAANPTSTSARK